MNQQSVQLTIRADTTQFATSIRRTENEFKGRIKGMSGNAATGARRINRNFNSIGDNAQHLSQNIKQAAKSFVIFTGVATGIGYFAKKMLNLADNTAKTADKVGFTTDSLQELRLAASLTGVSQDKLESSLERFTKRLGEAASGTGIAAKVYKDLGIEITNADGSIRESDAVLSDVADAMQNMSSQAEKSATAAALFGREGVALSLTLKDGAQGLDEFRKHARELGLVIDEKLLRSAETANDQLDILARTLKAQVITAIVSFAPLITRTAQGFIDAIPAIKEFVSNLAELKGVLLFLGKVFVVGKIVSFAKHLTKISTAAIVATRATSNLSAGFQLFAKSIKQFAAVNIVILSLERLVKLATLFKSHLNIKSEARKYVQSQQAIMRQTEHHAKLQRLTSSQFLSLSKLEQRAYLDNLKTAKGYWQAKLQLKSRQNPQSQDTLNAAKDNRLYAENIKDVSHALSERRNLELQHAEKLDSIRQSEISSLQTNLESQLTALDEANNRLEALKSERETIAKGFEDLIQKIQNASVSKRDVTVLDIGKLQNEARSLFKDGKIDSALAKLKEVKNVIKTLSSSGDATKAYLKTQALASASIADEIMGAQVAAQESNVVTIKEKIAEIKADAQYLKMLTVGFDVEQAALSADELKSKIQARLQKNPLKIPVEAVPVEGDVKERASKIIKSIPGKAYGGHILGQGTSTSDSILARLSNGEFVIKAKAVKHYGASLISKLNNMQLPRFQNGGMVPPIRSMPQTTSRNQNVATLNLKLDNQNYALKTSDIDVVDALTKAVAREALKSGRRI